MQIFERVLSIMRDTTGILAKKVQTTSKLPSLLSQFGRKVWNSLPPHIKSCKNLEAFKRVLNIWDKSTCNCRVWKNWRSKMLFQRYAEALLNNK